MLNNSYIIQIKNNNLISKSSSGGMFAELAKYILARNGIVFGCAMERLEEGFDVKHIYIEKEEDLYKLQGSKYVQSNLGKTIKQAKEFLEQGRFVLFSGTPCQIAGLKAYLRKDYDNLYTMDFLCHGMPSQKMFSENIKYLSDKYKGKISDYKFRDKSLKGWGHVTSFYVDGKKHYEAGRLNAYFCGFIKNYLNRYSCYSCHFTGEKRCSDITVGDFWGCNDSSFSLKKGVSFAAINTQKGEELFEKIKDDFLCKSTTSEIVSEYNGTLLSSHNQNIPDIRKNIYAELDKCGYKHIVKRYLTPEKKILLQAKMRMDMLLNKIGK